LRNSYSYDALWANGGLIFSGAVSDGLIESYVAADIPYSSGNIPLQLEFSAGYQCGPATDWYGNEQCIADIDFSHSFTVLGAQLFDDSMNPVPDAVLVSNSGFDYQAGFVAPEPTSLILVGTSVIAVACQRRRRFTLR